MSTITQWLLNLGLAGFRIHEPPVYEWGGDTNFNSNVSLFGGNQSINWLYQPGIDIRPCGSLWILVVRLAIKIEQWAQAVTEMGALKWMEEHCRNTSVAHGNQNCHFQKSWHCCILQKVLRFLLAPSICIALPLSPKSWIVECCIAPNYWLQVVLAPPLYFFYTMSLPEAG